MQKSLSYIIITVGIISLFSLFSCEEQIDRTLQEGQQFVIVDALLTNEYRYQVAWIYTSVNEINEGPQPVLNAEVQLTDGIYTVNYIPDTSKPGRYISPYPFQAASGRTYRLSLHYNNVYDTAFARMEGITPMEAVVIVPWDSLYRYSYVPSNLPSMMEVYYFWPHDQEFTEKYGSDRAAETFYTLSIIDVSKEFAPEKLVIIFPTGTTIIRRKYSLNEQHQEFIRSLLLETEWRGGLFDVEQSNVPTNFRNGTRGWFGACMVLMDTVLVQ